MVSVAELDVSGIALSFRDPKALNPYNVVGIDGLDGGAFKPKYYLSPAGQKFYTLEQEPRDIVLKVGLNPDFSGNQTFSELRDDLYKVMSMSKSGRVDIHFNNEDEIMAMVSGFVTKIESLPSEKDQMMAVTISCDDPVLRDPRPILVNYDTFDLTDFVIQDDISTAPHGISLRLKFSAHVSSLVITDPTDSSWLFRVVPLAGFNAGDVLYLSSEFGQKQIRTLSRNLMGRVDLHSIWPIIFPGENHFAFNHPGSISLQRLSYHRAYWGV